MSLVTCRECGDRVSPEAGACPHCGAAFAVGTPEHLEARTTRGMETQALTQGVGAVAAVGAVFLLVIGAIWVFAPSAEEIQRTSPASLPEPSAPGERAVSGTVTVTRNSPPEVLLAFIDIGSERLSRAEVRPYERLLSRLDRRCVEGEQWLADMATQARETLREDRGIRTSILSILRAWDETVGAVPNDPVRQCPTLLATLMVSM